MTLVLVHGVPETTAIWDALLAAAWHDDVVALSPPGFGAPAPEGFEPTSDGYRDWLVEELELLGEPADLLGHDWGGAHVIRAATARPDLVRSVTTDVAGIFDTDYVWHDMARVWQAPGDGEAAVEAMAATPVADLVTRYVGAGMTESAARSCAEAVGPEMGRCILHLYRSAVRPNTSRWGAEHAALADRPRTVVLVPTEDPYTGGPDLARRTARAWDADVVELRGLGHWWMMQDADAGAAALASALRC